MSGAPEFVPARTPKMRALWMGQECGHVILNAGRPEGGHCVACDPDCENLGLRVTWLKLFVRSADRVEHRPGCPAAAVSGACQCMPIQTVSAAAYLGPDSTEVSHAA